MLLVSATRTKHAVRLEPLYQHFGKQLIRLYSVQSICFTTNFGFSGSCSGLDTYLQTNRLPVYNGPRTVQHTQNFSNSFCTVRFSCMRKTGRQ